MTIREALWTAILEAGESVLPLLDPSMLQLRKTTTPEHGDYQINGGLQIARQRGLPITDLLEDFGQALRARPEFSRVEVARNVFINLWISDVWLSEFYDKSTAHYRVKHPKHIVIDYSSPNIAKQMAIHHLRSTVLGDALTRLFRFLGHIVTPVNHIGDWGTQFGMLLAILEDAGVDASTLTLERLESWYQEAKQRYDLDAEFAETARHKVVLLQAGDPDALKVWKSLVDVTMQTNQRLYEALGVLLTPKDTKGESFYNPMLKDVVEDLKLKGIAIEQNGSVVVPQPNQKNQVGEAMATVIQKKDGGYLYATTDLACIKYRCQVLKAKRLLYCIDGRQAGHMQQVFDIARAAGYLPKNVQAEHCAFGMMLNEKGQPFKTRAGKTPKLEAFIAEAEQSAETLLAERKVDFSPKAYLDLKHALAIGSIKYADLKRNRLTDYRFSMQEALCMHGDTAPYLLYAYTRTQALLRKLDQSEIQLDDQSSASNQLALNAFDRKLMLKLLEWPEILIEAAEKSMPHLLCHYLNQLAALFSQFYEHCPIVKEPHASVKVLRTRLVQRSADCLKQGLLLLGLTVIDRM